MQFETDNWEKIALYINFPGNVLDWRKHFCDSRLWINFVAVKIWNYEIGFLPMHLK